MHSKLTYSTILLVATFGFAPVHAQTTSATKTVSFRDPLRAHVESIPEPPPILQQLSVRLSGALSGQFPDASIRFVLSLENKGPQAANIFDPLDIFSLQFTTIGDKVIHLPKRAPKSLADVERVKHGQRPKDGNGDAPYPAPIQFRQIVRGDLAGYQKEDLITIPPAGKVEIVFESEPIVIEKVVEALKSETGEKAKSVRVRATMALVGAPLRRGDSRGLVSDWIYLNL
jgi:hypothetical protein